MEIQKTTGIILSSHTYGEADIISNVLTKDYGKRKFIFKGIKKSKTRSKSVTEPGTTAQLLYYFNDKKDSFVVNEFTVQKFNAEIRNDLQKILHLYFILESTEKTCGYNISDIKVFDLLYAGIDTLAKTDKIIYLTAFYIIHLLKINGILPVFDACKICGTNNFNDFTFDIIDFKPICKKCSNKHIILNKGVREFIITSLSNKFIVIDHTTYEEKSILDLIFYQCLFIENYYHIQIKSKEYILSSAL